MSKLSDWLGHLLGKKSASAKSRINVSGIDGSLVGLATGAGASVNFYKSTDYQALQTEVEEARENAKEYPANARFQEALTKKLQHLEAFKRDVLKLAEDFAKIPINTERQKQAKQYFESGEYAKARAILDTEQISHDQSALLDKQQRLDAQQAGLKQQLIDNANEFILKAKLTAVDYGLEDRIGQTRQLFESALKSTRTPENLFEYAYFLANNNQFQDGEKQYQEALGLYRQLAKQNPAVYNPAVATTLNNLGNLVADDNGRRGEAEALYQEALGLRRQLAKQNPAVYNPDVAMTLNNLGILVKADNGRRGEAEALYQEALGLYRQLAKQNPAVYNPAVANTLGAFGAALLNWKEPGQARPHLEESAALFAPLAQQAPGVYGAKHQYVLALLGQAKQK